MDTIQQYTNIIEQQRSIIMEKEVQIEVHVKYTRQILSKLGNIGIHTGIGSGIGMDIGEADAELDVDNICDINEQTKDRVWYSK